MHVFYWDFLDDITQIAELLQNNAIIAGETDTVLGLFGNCTPEAFTALNSIKKRTEKPYIVLVASIYKAKKLISPDSFISFEVLASLIWPGPFTIITQAATRYTFAAAPDGTIAIRIPDEEKIRHLLDYFDAVFSTSANISGESIPTSFETINPEILKSIAGYVRFKDKKIQKPPSTIIKQEGYALTCIRGIINEQLWNTLKKAGFHKK